MRCGSTAQTGPNASCMAALNSGSSCCARTGGMTHPETPIESLYDEATGLPR